MRFVQQKFRNILILISIVLTRVINCHHFKMEQYIPYSLICDLFSRNVETYLHVTVKELPPLIGTSIYKAVSTKLNSVQERQTTDWKNIKLTHHIQEFFFYRAKQLFNLLRLQRLVLTCQYIQRNLF